MTMMAELGDCAPGTNRGPVCHRVAHVAGKSRAAGYHILSLDLGVDPWEAIPGQFVMLRLPDRLDPLLARPYSVYGLQGRHMEVLVAAVGKGTRLLAGLPVGGAVDVLGPLGTKFPVAEEVKGADVILVGGGVGIAPLRYWLQAHPEARGQATLIHGARSGAELYELPEAPAEVLHTTDDGSQGRQGTVLWGIEELSQRWGAERFARATLLTCGPEVMMAAVVRETRGRVAQAYASLEAHMACGMGACLGCVVPDGRGGYLRVCNEGPVVSAERLERMYA